ncbi:N-6 DNA methylase [Streptomyces sp. CMB-StM0423]|uniref:N-6 DNA methylase n=1 Tax=Streptomyces sp. CMB-StM0423 TaxID=2059884 RepID=UPI000C7079C0|nr:N-6 DNA methylase [Streptomyces sp. CMB-StM0423]AUH42140.1 SAM-dependent methyltransferase [Streptomyces sp. CMB-StM0423]
MKESTPAASESLLTGAEIARLAGVTRAAVSNWRRRYSDFPAPADGGANTPLFALTEVRSWLAKQQKGIDLSDDVRLWQALRSAFGDDIVAGIAGVALFLAHDDASTLDEDLAELATRVAAKESAARVVDQLVERFLDSSRRTGSDQITSPRLVRAVSHFAGPMSAGSLILDPACGIGSLLLSVGPANGPERRGQEINPAAAELTQARADLAGNRDTAVEAGDSLRQDRWPELRADLVLCDPPAAGPDWGREELLLDARWELGVPSKAEGDLAWLQHCYSHTAPGGRVVAVMPASVAYRKAGRRIRAEVVRRGILTDMVALPPGMVASHAQPVHLWILRRPVGTSASSSSVRMVDLTTNDPDAPMEPAAKQAVDVPLVDLLNDSVDLTPSTYVDASRGDLPTEYRALQGDIEERLRRLTALLPTLSAGEGPGMLDGATISLADLSRAGLVDITDAEPHSTSDQLDTEYLRGFLRSVPNRRRSTSSSGTYRLDVKGARIPQMAVEEQRRYGAAFRALREFEEHVGEMARLAEQVSALAREGLTNGALLPPEDAA